MTRTYSEGSVGPDDDGDIMIAIAADHKHKTVRIAFEHPVTWFAMGKEQAKQLANTILKRAEELE